MPPIGTLKMLIWRGRLGSPLRDEVPGPIKVLRGKNWRYMKRGLEQFSKKHREEYGEALRGRLIWREGNRKHQVENPGLAVWCENPVCSAPDSL